MNADNIDKSYLDTTRSVEERARLLVSQMTLREKIAQMLHTAPPIPRLDVPAYNWWNECLHGVARGGRATVFPQAIGMAAAFDERLMLRVATAISDEARAKHHAALQAGNRAQYLGLTYWSPNINIFRDPRWGRGQETYGEDPYLTARLGVAFVRGLQGDNPRFLKLAATAKHYAVHSGPEPDRHGFDAVVNQRDLRETYLPAFQALVQEAGVEAVMGAYNRTNGEPCCASPTLLGRILRQEWGFKGHVVSDCGAITDFHAHHKITQTPEESVALAVRNGCDLCCGDIYPRLLEAVKQGLVTEEEITASVERIFRTRFRLGMFDPPEQVPYAQIPASVVSRPQHRKLALEMARESVVLLKNKDGLLPLKQDIRNIMVIGPNANNQDVLLGNYNGLTQQMTTILDGIVAKVGAGVTVAHYRGCAVSGQSPVNDKYIGWTIHDADVVIAVLGYTPALEGEEGDAAADTEEPGNGDRVRIGLPGRQLELLQRVHALGKPIVLVLTGGSPIELAWAAENIPAIIMSWYPGEAGGQAVADVLFGDYNPAGRLPVTFVRSLDQLPPFKDYAMKNRTYRFMESDPLYRFGYGISYTTFRYSDLRLSRRTIRPDGSVKVRATVANTGDRAGDEVVQLYVSDVQASVPVPRRHLEGFRRVHLAPGASKTVTFTLTPAQLAAFADDGSPLVEPGEFTIAVGGGQPDDPAAGAVTATLTVREVSSKGRG